MTLAQKLLNIIEDISDEKLCEIIDFAEYLKAKELKENRSLINSLVEEYDEALTELGLGVAICNLGKDELKSFIIKHKK